MSVRYLLDTDVLLDLINGDAVAIDYLDSLRRSDNLAVSTVSLAEIYAGVTAGSSPDRTRARIEQFLSTTTLEMVPLTVEPARMAGLMFGSLVSKGLTTGLPDVMNAAIALVHGYTIVTRNVRHYRRIPDLNIAVPSEA